MTIYHFSDKTVELAKEALYVGFDVVERPDAKHLYLSDARNKYLVPHNEVFPEIKVGEVVSLEYITNFEECNRLYQSMENNGEEKD